MNDHSSRAVGALLFKLEASHGKPIGKYSSPKADDVAIARRLQLRVCRVYRSIEGYGLNTAVGGRSVSGNTLFVGAQFAQIIVFRATFFNISKNVVEATAQCTMITGGTRRVYHKQNYAGYRGASNQPYSYRRMKFRHRCYRACAEKNLKASQKARQARERLFANSMISNLFSQCELEVMSLYFVRLGGGGGGAKFVSALSPPGFGAGLGDGGGGVGFPSFDAYHIGVSIPFILIVLSYDCLRLDVGVGSCCRANRHHHYNSWFSTKSGEPLLRRALSPLFTDIHNRSDHSSAGVSRHA